MSSPSLIWTTAALDSALEQQNLAPWVAQSYQELRRKVLDETFPCTFGTVAQRKGELFYAFTAGHERERMLQATLCYLDLIRNLSVVKAATTAFALFIRLDTPLNSIDAYHDFGWSLLQYFHDHDPQPWPQRIPTDPDHPAWSFCLAGLPIFVNFKTPAHQTRRSRHLQNAFMLLIQPRDGFDHIAGNTPQGRHARDIIRQKLRAYDQMPSYPALGHYGQGDNREWRQYALPDDNDTIYERCPLHING